LAKKVHYRHSRVSARASFCDISVQCRR
jgi:hypothetical protein